MSKYKYISKTEQDTIDLAQNIESEKFAGMIICLDGDLGTGKTVFTKAFAGAMEIEDTITSPTYNIIKEYKGDMNLYHMDVYRIDDNVEEIGLVDYFKLPGIIIVEWSEMIKDYLPNERLEIRLIASSSNESHRVIKINAYGDRYESICENIL